MPFDKSGTFNVNNSITINARYWKGKTNAQVGEMNIVENNKGAEECMSLTQVWNIKMAIKFLVLNDLASSVNTDCGLVVGRGPVRTPREA